MLNQRFTGHSCHWSWPHDQHSRFLLIPNSRWLDTPYARHVLSPFVISYRYLLTRILYYLHLLEAHVSYKTTGYSISSRD